MTVHSLTKSAIFFTVGHAAQKTGTQMMDDIRGLITISPTIGWGLVLGTLAILGMPPFGVFASEFLILTTAMQRAAVGDAVPAGRARRRVCRRSSRRCSRWCSATTTAKRLPHPTGDDPGVRAPRARADARTVDSAVPRRLVPAGGAADRLTMDVMAPSSRSRRRRDRCGRAPGAALPVQCRAQLPTDRAALAWEQRRAARRAVGERRSRPQARLRSPRVARHRRRRAHLLEHDAARRRRTLSGPRRAIFPAANRMQRAAFDLVGVAIAMPTTSEPVDVAGGMADRPVSRCDAISRRRRNGNRARRTYAFVRVEGDGVHEIPVGPVHAGIIEPGHFRFQVVGEKVLRLEERLGYVHKGDREALRDAAARTTAYRLAGRISGDSARSPTHGRYAQAVEAIAARVVPPARASWLRALLPGTRAHRPNASVATSVISATTAGFAFGLAQFSRLKEDVLRVNASMFGHRMLMDAIVPGGVASDHRPNAMHAMRARAATLSRARDYVPAQHLRRPSGLQDRLSRPVSSRRELAEKLGLAGLAGRASGQLNDQRVRFPAAPYDKLAVVMPGTERRGDVAARVAGALR